MRKDDKAVVLGEVTEVMLWGFNLLLTDRRTGESAKGYAVETGNEDYELDDAVKTIRQRYGAMGYTVNTCEFDEERRYTYDAVNEFMSAEAVEAKAEPQYADEDNDTSYSDEMAAAMAELGD